MTDVHEVAVQIRFERLRSEGLKRGSKALRSAGIHPPAPTLIRWFLTQKLEGVKIAGMWFTSDAAVRRFIEASNPQRSATSAPPSRASHSHAARDAAADRILASHGVSARRPER